MNLLNTISGVTQENKEILSLKKENEEKNYNNNLYRFSLLNLNIMNSLLYLRFPIFVFHPLLNFHIL